MRAVIVLTSWWPETRSLFFQDDEAGATAWELNSSVSEPSFPTRDEQVAELTRAAGGDLGPTLFERVAVEDVRVGDLIAKARGHRFSYVDSIGEGPVSRNLRNANGQTIMRPRRSVKLWRVT